jgi:hypothetical protein
VRVERGVRHSGSRSRRRLLGGLLALVTVVSISACTPPKTGAAAIVGQDQLTQTQLNAQASEVVDLVEQAQAANPSTQTAPDVAAINRALITAYVNSNLVDRLAQKYHVAVTDAELSAAIDNLQAHNGGRDKFEQVVATQASIPPEGIPGLIRFTLLLQKLRPALTSDPSATVQGQALLKAIDDEAAGVGVHVNPRYGDWQPSTGAISPDVGQLSEVATMTDGIPVQTGGGTGTAGLPQPGGG